MSGGNPAAPVCFNSNLLMGVQAEYSCSTSFSDVFFIDATTAQTIDAHLKNIAFAKEIGENANDTIVWLAGKREDWLLLFDNADDTTLNLSPFFPSCSHGNILITSRNRETLIHAPDSNYTVGSLTAEDARHLLLGIIKQVVTDETRILVELIVKVSLLQLASRLILMFDKYYRNLVIWPLPWCKLVHIF
jgi:hypothetical protein